MWGRTLSATHVLLLIICHLRVSRASHYEAGDELNLDKLAELLLQFKVSDSFSPIQEVISGIRPKVQTTSGLISGSKNQYANCFFSIPYADSPTDDLRYQPPIMVNTPYISRNLGKAENIICPQGVNSLPGKSGEYNENCLVLSVFVPASVDLEDNNSPPPAILPVLLFIHGGAFFIGAGTSPLYDGRYLSHATKSIVVTINYRLGPLGFLVFDDGTHKINGNQGLKDQRLAMKWVKKNIGNFGGDANKVTIFGESAGAQSTMFHLVSKLSQPYFQRAIMESNPAFYRYPDREQALERTNMLLEKLRCTGISEVDCCKRTISDYDCLMDSSAKVLIEGMKKVQKSLVFTIFEEVGIFEAVEPFRPYIDKLEFADQPMRLFKDGKWNTNKPFIIGTNKEELVKWTEFLKRVSPKSLKKVVTYVVGEMGKDKALALPITNLYNDLYRSPPSRISGILSAIEYIIGLFLTNFAFTCPTRALARFAQATTASKVHLYVFDHALDCDVALNNSSYFCGNSVHGEELVFVFRTLKHMGMNPNMNDVLVSNVFSTYWGNMAWSGDPSVGNNLPFTFPKWPPYTKGSKFTRWPNLRITAPPVPHMEYDHLNKTCDLFDKLKLYI